MAKNLDIIKRAMKKIHVLASGAEPTAPQAADGMAALQSLMVELIGQGSLGRLHDVLATSAYTAREFDRIQKSAGVVVTIPTVITPSLEPCGGTYDYGFRDAAPIGSSNRPPRDRACIVVIDSTGDEIDYVWSAYKGGWQQIQELGQQDGFPFAQYLEDGFAAMLAERIVDDYDQELGKQTALQAGRCRQMLSLKMDSASQVTRSEYI